MNVWGAVTSINTLSGYLKKDYLSQYNNKKTIDNASGEIIQIHSRFRREINAIHNLTGGTGVRGTTSIEKFFNHQVKVIIEACYNSLLHARHLLHEKKETNQLAVKVTDILPQINNQTGKIADTLNYLNKRCVLIGSGNVRDNVASLLETQENYDFLESLIKSTPLSNTDFSKRIVVSASLKNTGVSATLYGVDHGGDLFNFTFLYTEEGNSFNSELVRDSYALADFISLSGDVIITDDNEVGVQSLLSAYGLSIPKSIDIKSINKILSDIDLLKWDVYRKAEGEKAVCQWHLSGEVINSRFISRDIPGEVLNNYENICGEILDDQRDNLKKHLNGMVNKKSPMSCKQPLQNLANSLQAYGGITTEIVLGFDAEFSRRNMAANVTIPTGIYPRTAKGWAIPTAENPGGGNADLSTANKLNYHVVSLFFNSNPGGHRSFNDYVDEAFNKTKDYITRETLRCFPDANKIYHQLESNSSVLTAYKLKHVSTKVSYPSLVKATFTLSDDYVKYFDLRSIKYPEQYIKPDYIEWDFVVAKFLSDVSSQVKNNRSEVENITPFTLAIARMKLHRPEITTSVAINSIVTMYYELLAQQNERKTGFLLAQQPSKQEFLCKALLEFLKADESLWVKLARINIEVKYSQSQQTSSIPLQNVFFERQIRDRVNNAQNPIYDENNNQLSWSHIALILRRENITQAHNVKVVSQALIKIFIDNNKNTERNEPFFQLLNQPEREYSRCNQLKVISLTEDFRKLSIESAILRSRDGVLKIHNLSCSKQALASTEPAINEAFYAVQNLTGQGAQQMHIDYFLSKQEQQKIASATSHFEQLLTNRYRHKKQAESATAKVNASGTLFHNLKEQFIQIARFVPFPPLQAVVVLDDVIEGRGAETTLVDTIFAFAPMLSQLKSMKNIAVLLHDAARFDLLHDAIKDGAEALKRGEYTRLALDTLSAVAVGKTPLHCGGEVINPVGLSNIANVESKLQDISLPEPERYLSSMVPVSISDETFYVYPGNKPTQRLYRFNPDAPSIPKPTAWFAAKQGEEWQVTQGLKGGGPNYSCLRAGCNHELMMAQLEELDDLLEEIGIKPNIASPSLIQEKIFDTAQIEWRSAEKGFVYKGLVFRGDTRDTEQVFASGFTLRQPVVSLEEVTGMRGGFEGGHDQLDPDGKGISTSAFYKRDNAGAWFYGGNKAGYTYLIDGRSLEGYHLYANRKSITAPADRQVAYLPWEINYGEDIPRHAIVGAFDANEKFQPNPHYNCDSCIIEPVSATAER